MIIVDSIDMGYGNMFHLVDGHSPEVSHYPASSFNYNGIRFIHINFLKGYHTYIPIITSSGGTTLNKVQSENQSAYPAPFKSNNAANPTPQAYPAP